MLQIRPSKSEFRSSDAHFVIFWIFGGSGVPTAHVVSPQHMWCGCTRLWFSPTTCVLWTHVQLGNNCKHGYWRNRLRTIFRCLPTDSPWKTGASIFLDLIFDLQKATSIFYLISHCQSWSVMISHGQSWSVMVSLAGWQVWEADRSGRLTGLAGWQDLQFFQVQGPRTPL